MANGLETAIARTRVLAGLAKARALDDRQLLTQFADGDEAAFTALVDRYGSLVMGVCRRVLQHTQDAEDAFQATFLVLARKAGKIAWQESVANWLHGVAYRVSCQVRREKARRPAGDLAFHEPAVNAPDPAWSEVKPVLDEELSRLPAKYRLPLILCCLEGKSRDEAAAQLDWSVGAVKGCLERGREILRTRLAKRGLALSAAFAAPLLIGPGAQAAVPLTVTLATARAGMALLAGQTTGIVSTSALTLAQGALHAMFMTKLKIAAAVLVALTTLAAGTGYVTHQVLAGNADADRTQTYDAQFAAEFPEFVAQREERKAQPSVSGIVLETDASKNTINVLIRRDDPKGETFEVAKDAKIVIREGRETKAAKFDDVKQRTRVVLLLDADKKIVQTIEILVAGQTREGGERGRNPETTLGGVLIAVDAAKNTITLQTGSRDPNAAKDTTYELAKDCKVLTRQGRLTKEIKLADLELKKPVQIKLDAERKKVLSIEIVISTRASGAVSGINVAANTITVDIGGGRNENATPETYVLAKDVKVFFHLPGAANERGRASAAKSVQLADVAVKSSVSLQLDDERKIVQSIDVNLPTLRGELQSVDADKHMLLLRQARGGEVGLEIAKDAKVLVNGKDGKLADLAVGRDALLTLSPDRMKVLAIQSPPPEGR